MENFWSLLKRTLKGTYVSVDPAHLQAYVDEQSFRFNNREFRDADRFVSVLSQIAGRRLTFKELITKELDSPLG
jgi:ISXO2 transposase-like protein